MLGDAAFVRAHRKRYPALPLFLAVVAAMVVIGLVVIIRFFFNAIHLSGEIIMFF
jgi:hypothetical protein